MLVKLRDLSFPLQPAPEDGGGCINLKVWNCTVLEIAVNTACSFSVDNGWTRTINSEIKATGGSRAPHFCLPLLACASIHLILIFFSLLSNHALLLALTRKQTSPAISFVRCATQTASSMLMLIAFLLLLRLATTTLTVCLVATVFIRNIALSIKKRATRALAQQVCSFGSGCLSRARTWQRPRRADVSGDNDTSCGVAGTRSSSGGRLWRGRHGTQSTRARC